MMVSDYLYICLYVFLIFSSDILYAKKVNFFLIIVILLFSTILLFLGVCSMITLMINYEISFDAAFCCAPNVLIEIVLVSLTEFGLLYLQKNRKEKLLTPMTIKMLGGKTWNTRIA